MAQEGAGAVFDYRALRFMMGVIALVLPPLVSVLAGKPLSSISASFYDDRAMIWFIGLLFFISAFLFAYNGHTPRQSFASKLASIAAVTVATCPTNCDTCPLSVTGGIHLLAASLLFAVLAYFCFSPFREHTRSQAGKRRRRDIIYLFCGTVMLASMAVIVLAHAFMSHQQLVDARIVYWGETIALAAFGVGWITAGKVLPVLVDDNERLHLFARPKNLGTDVEGA